jgi:hypothetical protein
MEQVIRFKILPELTTFLATQPNNARQTYLVRKIIVSQLGVQSNVIHFTLSTPDIIVPTPVVSGTVFLILSGVGDKRSKGNIEFITKFAKHNVHSCGIDVTLLLQQITNCSGGA